MILNLHVGRFVTLDRSRAVIERGERVAYCRFPAAERTWSDGTTTRWDASTMVRVECDWAVQFLAPQDVLLIARSFDPSAKLLDPDPHAPEIPAARGPAPAPVQAGLALDHSDPTLPPARRSR